MTTMHEHLANTITLLRAAGHTGTPAELTALADEHLADRSRLYELSARIRRPYGWHPNPDDDGDPAPIPQEPDEGDLPIAA